MPFLVFIGYQKYRKNEKNIGEKCFGVSILFKPNLDNLQPVVPHHGQQQNIHC